MAWRISITTERIFNPLGMSRTHFRDDHAEIVPSFANGYVRAGDSFRTSVTNFNTTGATSLVTTPEDLLRWDENGSGSKRTPSAIASELLTSFLAT